MKISDYITLFFRKVLWFLPEKEEKENFVKQSGIPGSWKDDVVWARKYVLAKAPDLFVDRKIKIKVLSAHGRGPSGGTRKYNGDWVYAKTTASSDLRGGEAKIEAYTPVSQATRRHELKHAFQSVNSKFHDKRLFPNGPGN